MFDDSITSISEDGEVSFEHGAPRRFDLVIGADGLHSNVRRVAFGAETGFSTFIGAYLAVLSVPNYLHLDGDMIVCSDPGRMAGIYSARHMTDARAVFLFRGPQLNYSHKDIPRQKELLRQAFTGMGWQVPHLMTQLECTPAFYFDSISQIHMTTWSRGRVSLVGDAGYCPGPAVGTSLAVVGAFVLAGELAAAGGDHVRGFRAYEHEIGDYVRRSRAFAVGVAKRLIPDSRTELWLMANVVRLVAHIPPGITRALAKLDRKGIRLHDIMTLKTMRTERHLACVVGVVLSSLGTAGSAPGQNLSCLSRRRPPGTATYCRHHHF